MFITCLFYVSVINIFLMFIQCNNDKQLSRIFFIISDKYLSHVFIYVSINKYVFFVFINDKYLSHIYFMHQWQICLPSLFYVSKANIYYIFFYWWQILVRVFIYVPTHICIFFSYSSTTNIYFVFILSINDKYFSYVYFLYKK